MKYVYLVYEECHGLTHICGTPELATEIVNREARECGINPDIEPSIYGGDSYGWDEIRWRKEEVLY